MQLRGARTTLAAVRLRKSIRCSRYRECTGATRSSAAAVSAPLSMEPGLLDLVKAIHKTDHKVVVYVTGGASQALGWLLSVPGASNTVLEMTVPYARDSLISILSKEPKQYCAEQTALDLARKARERAAALSSFGTPVIGLAATCSLAAEPPKRGQHKVHICADDGSSTVSLSAILSKGARTRLQEDDVSGRLLLKVLAQASGVASDGFDLRLLTNGNADRDQISECSTSIGEDPLAALLAGQVQCVEYSGGRVLVDTPRRGKAVLPGSFNPLHVGHKELLAAALKLLGPGAEGCFELSVGNPDKGMLALEEVRRRVQQFAAEGLPLVVTRCPLFVHKADLMPGSRFVVGFDTAVRLLMPKYHQDSMQALLAEYQQLRAAGCSFIVAGRLDTKTERFWSLEDMEVPSELTDLFTALPEGAFRLDVSSTQLRAQMASPQTPSPPPPSASSCTPLQFSRHPTEDVVC